MAMGLVRVCARGNDGVGPTCRRNAGVETLEVTELEEGRRKRQKGRTKRKVPIAAKRATPKVYEPTSFIAVVRWSEMARERAQQRKTTMM